MNTDRETLKILRRDRNVIAAALSVIPGLGHIYKGHTGEGLVILLLGVPLAFWVGILLSLATMGAGLLVPIAAWAVVVMDAYIEKDCRKHHWFGVM